MQRILMAVALASTTVAAVASEPATFGREHIPPTLICSVESSRYSGTASLKAAGSSKQAIEAALLASKGAGETDESIQLAATQITQYAMDHSVEQIEQHAEEVFAACLVKNNLPVGPAVAAKCWRGFRNIHEIVARRQAGVSKESMLERAATLAKKNEVAGEALRQSVERVYAANGDLKKWTLAQLVGCVSVSSTLPEPAQN